MKKTRIWILLSVISLSALSIFCYRWFTMKIDSDFATKVFLEYHYVDKDISLEIADENDILTLKLILNGQPFQDSPACGFAMDISITMTNERKSITFCPACDGCSLLRIGDSNKYIKISDEARVSLNEILKKYGMTFPCI